MSGFARKTDFLRPIAHWAVLNIDQRSSGPSSKCMHDDTNCTQLESTVDVSESCFPQNLCFRFYTRGSDS